MKALGVLYEGSLPYILILLVIAAIVVFWLFKKLKKLSSKILSIVLAATVTGGAPVAVNWATIANQANDTGKSISKVFEEKKQELFPSTKPSKPSKKK